MMERLKTLSVFIVGFSLALFASPTGGTEQETLPSQKTKEAVEKFKKAPAAAGRGLRALKDAGQEKLAEIVGGGAPPIAKAPGDSLSLPTKKTEVDRPRYSSAGRRDPFRPLTLRAKAPTRARENLSPLERYELGQLKLVAVIWDVKEPRAMVEDAAGLGYIVTRGTLIGPNEGKVKEIKPAEVVVEENYVDFYGARQSREISLKLPAE
jgi:Tfp pilus assembly protein PilP